MLRHLKRALAVETGPIRECRHCGTTVEETAVGCPACGSAEIATYDV